MGDLFSKIGIDWKLLLFQAVNFLILLFLLKKFLYKPIISFLEKRQGKIEEGLKKAEGFEKEWQKIEEMKEQEKIKIEGEAVGIIEKARKGAEEKEKDILESTRQKAEKMIKEAENEISGEREKVKDEIKKEMSKYIISATEKILGRTLKEDDEKRIAEETLSALDKNA